MTSFIRLLHLFGPHNGWLLLGLALALLAIAAQSALMFAALGTLSASLVLLWLLKLTLIARPVLRYAERLATHSATFRVLAKLRLWLFARLVPLAPGQLGHARSGDILSRLLGDVEALDGFYLRLLLPMALAIMALGAGLLALAQLSLSLALQAAGLLLTLLLILLILVRWHRASLDALPSLTGALRTEVMDGCTGLAELLTAQAADGQLHKISQASASLQRAQLAQARLRALAALAAGVFSALLLTLLLWQLPLLTSAATTLLITGIALVLLEAVPGLASAGQQWPGLQAASTRIFSLADTKPAITEPEPPAALPTDLTITLSNITLSYGRPRPALQDINIVIKPGERFWLSGPSGSGKTSLLQLLLKFRAPEAGSIHISGANLLDLDGDSWRTQIGYLSQHTALLAGSVADNLRLAKSDANSAEMMAALEAAGLADFIATLPDGLNSWVGEAGLSFSDGQARRLALAQVLLRDAPIWLLDEPTEGVDETTAQAIMTTLAARGTGKSIVLVSHQPDLAERLQPTMKLRLKDGKITA